MHIYDYIIIGSGLTGLTIAHKISQSTKNVLLLESLEEIGGANKPTHFAGHAINNGLRFYPASVAAVKALVNLESQLNLKIIHSEEENKIETYEASGFKPFFGFGDKSPKFYDQLAYFLNPNKLLLNLQPWQWVQQLKESFSGTVLTRSFVTKLIFDDVNAKHPKVTGIMVNGNKTIHAHNFIFAAPLKELSFLMPDEIMSARLKNKISKAKSWQAVCVDLFHPNLSQQKDNLYILNGTTDDDLGPCVGKFISKEISQWLSFIDFEMAEDTENIGLVLKKLKRQIKRAFPELSEQILKERIYVSSSISGAELKLSANLTFPNVENLWISSATSATAANLTGALQNAQLTLAAAGFGASEAVADHAQASEITDLI